MTLIVTTGASLEALVEQAYGAILSQLDKFQGSQIPIICSMSQFVNEPLEGQDSGDDSNKPIPNITLTAQEGQESLYGLGVREVRLTIETTDNASRKGGDANTSDLLFENAIIPCFIKNDGSGNNFFQLLSSQITSTGKTFKCYGFVNGQRFESSDIERNGDLVTRRAVTNLICTELNS